MLQITRAKFVLKSYKEKNVAQEMNGSSVKMAFVQGNKF